MEEKPASDSKPKASNNKPIVSLNKLGESYQLRDKSGIIWRAWFLPIALEGRLERIGVYHTQRRPRDSGKDSDREDKKRHDRHPSRLVFAIDFTHTGALEIEAEHSVGKLRMAVRSLNSFSLEAQAGIRARFLEILQDLDLQGQIVFHKVDALPMSSLSAEETTRTTRAKDDEFSKAGINKSVRETRLDETKGSTEGSSKGSTKSSNKDFSNETTWEIKL